MDTEGIGKNIFNIIDGCYYIGEDATPEPEPTARGGIYALAYGPNKVIMDTGWSEENAWVGLHNSNIRWYSDLGEGDKGLLVEYWKIDEDGNEILARPPIECSWDPYNSDETGDSAGLNYFSENNQYRIIVKSHPTVPENKFVAVDYIRIVIVDNYQVYSGYISGVEEEDGAVAIQMDWPEIYSITGTGTTFALREINYPTPLEVLAAYPTMSSANFGYEAIPFLINPDSFTIRVAKYNGDSFSGTIDVVCNLKLFVVLPRL